MFGCKQKKLEETRTWDESTRKAMLWIGNDEDKTHSLPQIYYDICLEGEQKVCYISAVQNELSRKKIPKVERLLYKLNKDIEEENVHPNRLYAMKIFLEILKEHKIRNIRIPILHVLNYRYHELLSKEHKEAFEQKWAKDRIEEFESLNGWRLKRTLEEYQTDQINCNRFIDKQDLISKLKTENLIHLMLECTNQDPSLVLRNDVDTNIGYLEFQYIKK